MTTMAVPVPPSMKKYQSYLREFMSGMIRKLDMNSHKDTPSNKDVPVMTGMLLGEINEFLQQHGKDKSDVNTLIELMDAANMAFLMYVALREQGVETLKDKLVKEMYSADLATGKVYCKATRAGSQYKVGEEVLGSKVKDGYVYINCNRHRNEFGASAFPRSHMIWFFGTGKWPTGVIDHKNSVRDDDRFENLRDVTFSDNCHNKGKGKYGEFITRYAPNGRDHLPHFGKYVYQRTWNGKNIRVAYFDTVEEAKTIGAEKWLEKAKKLDAEVCARTKI